jgi:hypothetical protein
MGKIHSICTLIPTKTSAKHKKETPSSTSSSAKLSTYFAAAVRSKPKIFPVDAPLDEPGGRSPPCTSFWGETLKGKDDNENIVVSHHFP